MDGDVHPGRATLVRARAQPVTDHLLEPAYGSLGAGPSRVSGRLLSGGSAVLDDELKMMIPLCGLGLGRLARHGR